ncbi:CHASE domain-containing protein [Colwellia sp. MEBiC06753]
MIRVSDFLTSLISLLLVIAIVNFSLSPFSVLNFFGAVAGTASALVVLKGPRILLSFWLSIFIVLITGHLFGEIDVTPELIILGVLSISLQSVWAAQLTAKEMQGLAWLASREKLTRFLFRLGPLPSVISASAVLVLISVSEEGYASGIFYSFALTWSISQLVAVFLLPVLLFSIEQSHLNQNKRYQLIVASIIAAVALSILFRVSQSDYQHKRHDDFNLAVSDIKVAIDNQFSDIHQQLSAIEAFFQASDSINYREFTGFSQLIYQPESTVKAVEWAPVIRNELLDEFQRWAQIQYGLGYKVGGTLNPESPFLAPVLYAYPREQNKNILGINMFGDSQRSATMLRAAELGQAVSTGPLTFIDQQQITSGIVIFKPFFNLSGVNAFGGVTVGDRTQLDGFILLVVQMAEVLDQLVTQPFAEHVVINVQDVTNTEPYNLYGEHQQIGSRLHHVIERQEFNRLWRINIVERTAWLAQPRNWLNWGVLLGCALGGFLYQMLLLLMTAYSAELNQKVADKTKELIIQKEQSDQKNKAKSQFLVNLSNELKTPTSALTGLLAQLNEQSTSSAQQKLIEKINNVAANLMQVVDTLSDLTDIEQGKLVFQSNGFDFYIFLQQIETMLNVSTERLMTNVSFIFDESIPHYVVADKLRLQQLIVALINNGALIFNNDRLNVSIKAHRHQNGIATIFMVVTPDTEHGERKILPKALLEQEFENLTTSMTMAKEICQRLDGAIKLAPVPESGDYMLSASFKLTLDGLAQVATNNLDSSLLDLSGRHIVIVCDDEEVVDTLLNYFDKFECTIKHYQTLNEKVINEIALSKTDIIFLACIFSQESGFWLCDKMRRMEQLANTPLIGIAPESMSMEQYSSVQSGLESYISKPVKLSALNQIVQQYL